MNVKAIKAAFQEKDEAGKVKIILDMISAIKINHEGIQKKVLAWNTFLELKMYKSVDELDVLLNSVFSLIDGIKKVISDQKQSKISDSRNHIKELEDEQLKKDQDSLGELDSLLETI